MRYTVYKEITEATVCMEVEDLNLFLFFFNNSLMVDVVAGSRVRIGNRCHDKTSIDEGKNTPLLLMTLKEWDDSSCTSCGEQGLDMVFLRDMRSRANC